MQQSLKILIDSREARSGVIELIKNNESINFEITNLKYGDYIVNDKIIFERKTLADFLVSIKEGRFFKQSYKMTNRKIPFILILEGTREGIKNSEMKREAVQGALIHISIFLGIPILRSKNLAETLNLMLMSGNQLDKQYKGTFYKVYNPFMKYKKNNPDKLKLQVIHNLPGIGQERAKILLREYCSLKKLFNTNINRLLKIKGIGVKTAEKIVKLIN